MEFTALFAASMLALPAHAAPRDGWQHARADRAPLPVGPLVERVAAASMVPPRARPYTTIVSVDRNRLGAFARAGGGVLERFPLSPTVDVSLALTPMSPADAGASIERIGADRRGRLVADPVALDGVFLSGGVAGIAGSHAFLASSAAGTFGYVEVGGRTFIISSGPTGSGLPTVAYDLTSMPAGIVDGPAWTCDAADPPEPPQAFEGSLAGADPCRQIRIAYETDHEFLQLFGGDVEAASGYIGTLASALTSIYARDLNARLSVSYVRLWETADDPWTQGGTAGQLGQFVTHWSQSMQSVPRDLAHFLSGRALGGGIAYLPGLCGAAPFGLSANLGGFFPTPLLDNNGQNWDLYVVAHEIGHNFGAPHTHSYSPPLDGCGSSPPDCTAAELDEGTIMSYCHLCAGGVQNIQLRFHPGNIATMQAHLASVPCDYTGPARPPIAVADAAEATNASSATIDVLANEIEFNCEDIAIDLFDATTPNGGTVSRSVGTGPGGRDRLVYTNGTAFLGTDSFSYMVRDASGQTAFADVLVSVLPLRVPENPVNPSPQLDVSYYALSAPIVLPNFAALSAYQTGAVPQVNFGSTGGNFLGSGRANDVGAVFRGYLDVPADGEWTLFIASDDGSRVSIGDTVVVSNDGVHEMREASGSIALARGRHALRIEFFEATGGAGVVFSWSGPGVPKQVVPASALFRGGLITPADINNDGRVDAIDVAILLGYWGTSSPIADLNGSGMVTAADMTVLLNDWTG
ncbi:MAG: M12 family metallo-peptidase [Planctomycetota bacterium]